MKLNFFWTIKEKNEKKLFDTIMRIKKFGIEIRIDFLLENYDIIKCIQIINKIEKNFKNDIMLTVRSKKEFGNINIDSKTYFCYIILLYENTKCKFIDIEYNQYKKHKLEYDKIINCNKIKKFIISMHTKHKQNSYNSYKKIILDLYNSRANIIKFVVKMSNYNYIAKMLIYVQKISNSLNIDSNTKKIEYIFIVNSINGIISRVLPELTNTKYIFLNNYGKIDKLSGQVDYTTWLMLRKILEKFIIN